MLKSPFPYPLSPIAAGQVKMGRRKSLSVAYLPPELCTEILSRLPVKTLLRFRSVCKSWCSLIDDSDFISMHFTRFKNNSNQSHLILMDHPTTCGEIRCIIRRSETFRKSSDLDFSIEQNQSFVVVGYINGLLPLMKLVYSEEVWKFCSIILWNPSIRKCLNLPPSSFSHMSKATFIEPGFGFDFVSNDYKVVLIMYPAMKMYNAQVPVLVEVYSTKTGSWRNLTFNSPRLRCLGPTVFLDGSIHWLGCDMRGVPWMGKSSHIVSFNVGEEVFSYLELPGVEDDGFLRERLPMEFGRSLGLLDVYREYNYVWVMGKGGARESWTKMYSIDVRFGRFLCLKQDSELLYATKLEGVHSYDIKSQQNRVLAKTFPEYVVYAGVYVESLVLSTAVNGQPLQSFP